MEHGPHTEPESRTHPATTRPTRQQTSLPSSAHDPHGGHGLLMMICCIPMLVIAVALVATGVAGSGTIITALLCTAMMAAMMFTMHGGHGPK